MSDINLMIETTKYIEKYAKTPYLNKLPKRICIHTCYGITCLPCYIWSTIWRILACPFQCMVNGTYFICSNNHCTNHTDKCIYDNIGEVNKRITFTNIEISKLSNEDKQKLLEFIEYLKNIFNVISFTRIHYILCDIIIKPLTSDIRVLPNQALYSLETLKLLIQNL